MCHIRTTYLRMEAGEVVTRNTQSEQGAHERTLRIWVRTNGALVQGRGRAHVFCEGVSGVPVGWTRRRDAIRLQLSIFFFLIF